VTQTLFSASLIAEVLPRLYERDREEGSRRLQELRELTRGALAEMRMLLLELRPATLTEVSLGDLLRQLAEATTGRSRVPIEVSIEGGCSLPPDVHIALYRIAQEALNNVARHAGATCASLHLRCNDSAVEMRVRDDGRGFDVGSITPAHLGVSIMRERAEDIMADLDIESGRAMGTTVSVTWRRREEANHE
jgi:signal transduction histidine kinase